MLKRAAIAAIALACATGALADAEKECQGLSGTPDQNIVACSQVIKADSQAARTYFNRGLAYQDKGEFDRAIADFDKVIALDPKDADSYIFRGLAYQGQGDLDRAIVDYRKALELEPKNGDAWRMLGMARYDAGDFKGAAADLLRSMEIDENAYAMLYRFLARSRAGEAAEAGLEADARRLKTQEWPFAVIELYLGKRSPAATLAAAATPDQKCLAQFYIGEWHVVKGNRADAETALRAAVDTCPKPFVEYRAAVVELKRLKP